MEIGDKLFKFNLKGTDGKNYDSYTFADRNALVFVITCNHCPYARAYWNRLIKLYNHYNIDNIGIIAINPNDPIQYPEDSFDNMVKLFKQLDLPFPYLFDENQEVAQKFGASRTPEAFLFNSKRELVYKGAIDNNWESEELVSHVYLEDAIEYTLDGMGVDFPEIEPVGCSIKWKK